MNAWFAPEIAPWFSMFSLLSLLATFYPMASRGQRRSAVVGIFIGAVAVGVVLLATAGIAWLVKQPQHVSDTLLLSGSLVTVLCLAGLLEISRVYRQAELRRTVAKDL